MANLLVVFDDVAEVIATAVVCLPHAHAIVREVDVAVVAEKLRHFGGGVVEDVARCIDVRDGGFGGISMSRVSRVASVDLSF